MGDGLDTEEERGAGHNTVLDFVSGEDKITVSLSDGESYIGGFADSNEDGRVKGEDALFSVADGSLVFDYGTWLGGGDHGTVTFSGITELKLGDFDWLDQTT